MNSKVENTLGNLAAPVLFLIQEYFGQFGNKDCKSLYKEIEAYFPHSLGKNGKADLTRFSIEGDKDKALDLINTYLRRCRNYDPSVGNELIIERNNIEYQKKQEEDWQSDSSFDFNPFWLPAKLLSPVWQRI